MRRLLFAALLLVTSVVFLSCHKDSDSDESIFYGTWIKGTAAGDTLRFFRKDGKNLLAYNLSFNAALWAPTEVEYRYEDGKLFLINYWAQGTRLFPIPSFTWKQYGKEFELQGIEIYPFMSSMQVRFSFRKVE